VLDDKLEKLPKLGQLLCDVTETAALSVHILESEAMTRRSVAGGLFGPPLFTMYVWHIFEVRINLCVEFVCVSTKLLMKESDLRSKEK